jgi:hypothetical protein
MEKELITELDDNFFAEYANKIANESKKSNNSFTPRSYDPIGYAGCETGFYKIFRLIGAPPGSEAIGYKRKPYDPIEIMMCEVKDDKGKKFVIKLPLREDTPAHNHILHRLYDKVTEVAWIKNGTKNTKVFVNQSKYPELWEAVTKTGYKQDDPGYKMASGLKSTNFVIFNVIDRQDDWCKDNNHTKILCRQVTIDDKQNVWAQPGIKSWGFLSRLTDLMNKYKNYEKYDIAIKRTGQKDPPLELRNASVFKEKDMLTELLNDDGTIPDEKIIVVGPLSEAEKNYERYDLDKLYQATSYTKILNRLTSVIKLCDASLGTKFFEEFTSLSEKEKEEWKIKYGSEDEEAVEKEQAAAENKEINSALSEEKKKPVSRRTAVGTSETGLSDEKIALLKGWSKLTEAERALIKDVIVKDGKVSEIVWVECDETANLLACDCDIASPEQFSACAACGADFI